MNRAGRRRCTLFLDRAGPDHAGLTEKPHEEIPGRFLAVLLVAVGSLVVTGDSEGVSVRSLVSHCTCPATRHGWAPRCVSISRCLWRQGVQ